MSAEARQAGSLMEILQSARRNATSAASRVAAVYEGPGVSLSPDAACIPGRHVMAVLPQDQGDGVTIFRRNDGRGAPSIDINNREEALWLANQLQRIFT